MKNDRGTFQVGDVIGQTISGEVFEIEIIEVLPAAYIFRMVEWGDTCPNGEPNRFTSEVFSDPTLKFWRLQRRTRPVSDTPITQSAGANRFVRSADLRRTAHKLIPGGAHTYAKGDDQYPVLAPGFIARGAGCHVWDVDGNEFIEYGMGLRAVSLGHAYPAVVDAAYRQMQLGTNFTRPADIEVACAERVLALAPGAEMIKFTKDGSTAVSAAVRLARAYTGRDKVAICADHPFFSYDDWAIGTTPMRAGIPREIVDLTCTFPYNDLPALEALFAAEPHAIAAVVMEPTKSIDPPAGYLQAVQDLCRRHGALFVLDEMISGLRWPSGSAQRHYGLEPDLCTFGKAIGNGFAVSALAGKREFMRLGGLDHDRERVFLLSTTHGAETHALAAAIAVLDVVEQEPVIDTMHERGARLREGVEQLIERHRLAGHVEIIGRDTNLVFATRDADKRASQVFRTLFMSELIRRGILAPSFVVSYSHTQDDIDRTIEAVDGALAVYRIALDIGPDGVLFGRPVQPVFLKMGNLAKA